MKTVQPEPLTPEAKHELERFLEAFEANVKRAQRVALSILVWGPSPSRDSPVSRKRSEIREQLIRLGHNATFSEDIKLKGGGISEGEKGVRTIYRNEKRARAIYRDS